MGDANDVLRELQATLEAEKAKGSSLDEKIKHQKQEIGRIQQMSEQEEEFITNKLNKRVDEMKLEKQKLVDTIEEEEEAHARQLREKLAQLTREKLQLQQQLETEEEFIVNKLHKQLRSLTTEKDKLARQLEEGGDALINTVLDGVRHVAADGPQALDPEAAEIIGKMQVDLVRMQHVHSQKATERDEYKIKAQEYEAKLRQSRQKQATLKAQVAHEHHRLESLIKSKCLAEVDNERVGESQLNLARRCASPRSPRTPTGPLDLSRASASPRDGSMPSPRSPRPHRTPDKNMASPGLRGWTGNVGAVSALSTPPPSS